MKNFSFNYFLKNKFHYSINIVLIISALWWLVFNLSFNLVVNTTNDSVLYLNWANDLSRYGFVHFGFKQFGYPYFLNIIYKFSEIMDINPLSTIVFFQRFLFFISVLLLVLNSPNILKVIIVVFFSNGVFIALASNIYPESLLFSLSILYLWFLVVFINTKNIYIKILSVFFALSIVCFGACIKLTYFFLGSLIFGIVCHHFIFHNYFSLKIKNIIYFSFVVFAFIASFFFSLYLVFNLSNENLIEHNEFFPVVNTDRVTFWGVYKKTFTKDFLKNEKFSDVSYIYADNKDHEFIHNVVECNHISCPKTLKERSDLYKRTISLLKEKNPKINPTFTGFLKSFLYCGSLNDQGGALKNLSQSLRKENTNEFLPYEKLNNNRSKQIGKYEYSKSVGNGYEIFTIQRIFNFGLEYKPQNLQLVFLIFTIFFTFLKFNIIKNFKNSIFIIICYLGPFILFIIAYLSFVDIWRYLLPTWIPSVFIFYFLYAKMIN